MKTNITSLSLLVVQRRISLVNNTTATAVLFCLRFVETPFLAASHFSHVMAGDEYGFVFLTIQTRLSRGLIVIINCWYLNNYNCQPLCNWLLMPSPLKTLNTNYVVLLFFGKATITTYKYLDLIINNNIRIIVFVGKFWWEWEREPNFSGLSSRYKYNTWIIREVWPKLLRYLVIRTNGNNNERQ